MYEEDILEQIAFDFYFRGPFSAPIIHLHVNIVLYESTKQSFAIITEEYVYKNKRIGSKSYFQYLR